jgi:hypothetical protein
VTWIEVEARRQAARACYQDTEVWRRWSVRFCRIGFVFAIFNKELQLVVNTAALGW